MVDLLASLAGQHVDLIRCPDGEALAGLRGHALVWVDDVDGILCRPFGEATLASEPGGVGGTGGEAFVQFCPQDRSVAALHRYQLAARLAAAAVRCDPEP